MKQHKLLKFLGTGLLAAGLVLTPLALPGSAQTAPDQTTTENLGENNQPNLDTTPFQETKGQTDNFGWLGILGALGLLNLLRKPDTGDQYVRTGTNPNARD
jgi:hypothetical protein